MIYKLFFNYYNKLPDMCGEASRLSRAKSNMNIWERIRNKIAARIVLLIFGVTIIRRSDLDASVTYDNNSFLKIFESYSRARACF